jgi:hypothetical protein
MAKLPELGTYSYQIESDGSDLKKGDKITFRRMSEKERKRFAQEDVAILGGQVEHLAEIAYTGTISTEDRDRVFDELRKLSKVLCVGEDRKRIHRLKETNHFIDLIGIVGRVISVEMALNDGKDIPDQIKLFEPDDVENMDDKQLTAAEEDAVEVGELLPPSESAMTTTPISLPAATSSSGSEQASEAIESVASEISP